jgi:hypothetical protein
MSRHLPQTMMMASCPPSHLASSSDSCRMKTSTTLPNQTRGSRPAYNFTHTHHLYLAPRPPLLRASSPSSSQLSTSSQPPPLAHPLPRLSRLLPRSAPPWSSIGGCPTWLDPFHPPPPSLFACPRCARPMPLVVQQHTQASIPAPAAPPAPARTVARARVHPIARPPFTHAPTRTRRRPPTLLFTPFPFQPPTRQEGRRRAGRRRRLARAHRCAAP